MPARSEYSTARPPTYVSIDPAPVEPQQQPLMRQGAGSMRITLPPLSEFSSPPPSPPLLTPQPAPQLPPQASYGQSRSISAWSAGVPVLSPAPRGAPSAPSSSRLQPSPWPPMSAGLSSRGTSKGQKEDSYEGESREYSAGLCEPSFWGCCYSAWCPCPSYSQNEQRLRALVRRREPLPDAETGECTLGSRSNETPNSS